MVQGGRSELHRLVVLRGGGGLGEFGAGLGGLEGRGEGERFSPVVRGLAWDLGRRAGDRKSVV